MRPPYLIGPWQKTLGQKKMPYYKKYETSTTYCSKVMAERQTVQKLYAPKNQLIIPKKKALTEKKYQCCID